MVLMQVEMDMLKTKCTWDLVKPPPGVNVMDSMWVHDIKWDGEGNRIKDKARLVGKDIRNSSELTTTTWVSPDDRSYRRQA